MLRIHPFKTVLCFFQMNPLMQSPCGCISHFDWPNLIFLEADVWSCQVNAPPAHHHPLLEWLSSQARHWSITVAVVIVQAVCDKLISPLRKRSFVHVEQLGRFILRLNGVKSRTWRRSGFSASSHSEAGTTRWNLHKAVKFESKVFKKRTNGHFPRL